MDVPSANVASWEIPILLATEVSFAGKIFALGAY